MDRNPDKKDPENETTTLANHGGANRARGARGRQRGGPESGDPGDLQGQDFTGLLSLNVNGDEAVSGKGYLSIVGLNKAPIVRRLSQPTF